MTGLRPHITASAQIMPPKTKTGRLYTKRAANLAGNCVFSVMVTQTVVKMDPIPMSVRKSDKRS
jgi:hypothetical protein